MIKTRHRKRIKTGPIGNCLLAMVVITVPAILYVSLYASMASMEYYLQGLQHRTEVLHNQNEHHRIEIARLQSPENIEVLARSKLGMFNPEEIVFISVKPKTEKINVNKKKLAILRIKNRVEASIIRKRVTGSEKDY